MSRKQKTMSNEAGALGGFLRELAALRFTPWYRWHPQIAMRYLPAVEYIKRCQKRPGLSGKGQALSILALSILEVGSGGLGIAPYLKMPVTGVDKEFEPPFHPLLKRVVGDATELTFPNDSFDVVISIDMLEHLPKQKRQVAVLEMLRVAKSLVVIGVPCGQEAGEHDRKIKMRLPRPRWPSGPRNDDNSNDDKGFKFLDEQVEYGLPEEIDILHYIKASVKALRKQTQIKIEGNMNLKLREFLMRGWMSKNVLVNILFRKVFLLLIPVFRLLDKEPYYRKMFFVEIENRK